VDWSVAIKAMMGSLKAMLSLAQKYKDLELNQRIIDVQTEAQNLMIDLHEKELELHGTKKLLAEAEEKLKFKEKLVRSGESYFEAGEDGKPTGEPYCSHCWEVEHLAVHILRHGEPMYGIKRCPRCKTEFSPQYT